MIRSFSCEGFAPFGTTRLDFQEVAPAESVPEVKLAEAHLLIGPNGSGKTRLLSALAAFLGSPEHLIQRLVGCPRARFEVEQAPPLPTHTGEFSRHIGMEWDVLDWLGEDLFIGSNGFNRTSISSINPTVFRGLAPAFAYGGSPYLENATLNVFGPVPPPNRAECLSFGRRPQNSSSVLQAIFNLVLDARSERIEEGSSMGPSGKIIEALETAIRSVVEEPFRFYPIREPEFGLRVHWRGRNVPFGSLPDGLRSIVGWFAHAVGMMRAWLRNDENVTTARAIILFEEIETSLHPAWQRRVLPGFQALFPNAQLFVSTHSPFVISSLAHGWIHRLALDEAGESKITSSPASSGQSYLSVVEDLMGIKEWYNTETERLLARFRTLRDLALQGVGDPAEAEELAVRIAERGVDLELMMSRELSQMRRMLSARPET